MNQHRFEELMRQRRKPGLTDEEANELGEMMAEREGKPYTNAAARRHPQENVDQEQPYDEAGVGELKNHPDVQESPQEDKKAS